MFSKKELALLEEFSLGTSPRLALAAVHYYEQRKCPTYEQIAAAMGVSTDRAQRACKQLAKAGLVEITQEYKQPAVVTAVRRWYESVHS